LDLFGQFHEKDSRVIRTSLAFSRYSQGLEDGWVQAQAQQKLAETCRLNNPPIDMACIF
jgi:hypothetical protein